MSQPITLTGSNHFLLKAELARLKTKFVQSYGDINIETYDEETDVNDLISNVQAMPFLAEKRLVIIQNIAGKKALTERIDDVLAGVNAATELVIVEPHIDKRSSYYKTLKAKTDFREFNELDEPQLTNWLVAEAKAQGAAISPSDARYLVQRLGPNQQLLYQEITKLALYEPTISRATIDLLVEPTPQSTVFELLEAAFSGNAQKAISIYDEQRAMKVEPLNMLAMIAWQLHALALVKTAGERADADIAKQAGLNPFVVRKSRAIAKKQSLAQLKRLVAEAFALDIRLKSQSIDADEAMKQLLLTIATE